MKVPEKVPVLQSAFSLLPAAYTPLRLACRDSRAMPLELSKGLFYGRLAIASQEEHPQY